MRRFIAAVLVLSPIAATAQATGDGGQAKIDRPNGHVLTYFGLRTLEHDTSTSDEEKIREWAAFITRTEEQIGYAKQAVERWKTAAQLRAVEQAESLDAGDRPPVEKMKVWQQVLARHPVGKYTDVAKARVEFWRAAETKLRLQAAERTEAERKTKVERVTAWLAVLDWAQTGPDARAAHKRIVALQDQLFAEAQSLDRIRRVDPETRIASWKDVLAGAPTPLQRRVAEERIRDLDGSK